MGVPKRAGEYNAALTEDVVTGKKKLGRRDSPQCCPHLQADVHDLEIDMDLNFRNYRHN
jgi:hypothetical protein